MASLEFDSSAFDDLEDQLNTLTISCPVCGKEFDIALDDLNSSVTCPHCHADMEIESE